MSHNHIAAVWNRFQRRSDIDHILLELIGRYSLDIALCRNDFLRVRSISIQHVVALKVIFDLQRTYLQSSNPSFESKSALLHHDILFAAIIHLLDVKAEISHSVAEVLDRDADRSFIAQVLLSGLRALLLRRRSLSLEEHNTLTSRFDQVWRDERLENVDFFVVQSLCRRIIQELFRGARDSRYGSPACGTVELPDFFRKLYPVEKHEKSLTVAARNARCLSSSAPDWFQNALTLYDIYWSTVAALIQLIMDSHERKQSYTWTPADEFVRQNDLNAILATRFELLNQVYSFNYPRRRSEDEWINEQMKTLLLSGIHPSCSQDHCLCFNDDQLDIENLRITLGAQELSSRLKKYLSATQYPHEIESALKHLQLTLDSRTSALMDCNGELEDLSQKFQGYMQDWCPSVYPSGYDSKDISVQEDFYVVACPELHALPSKDIFNGFVEAIVEGERQEGDKPLVVGIRSNFICPHCIPNAQVVSARKIEPLSRISSQIQKRLQSWQQIMQKKVELQQVVPDCLKPGLEVNPRPLPSPNYPSPNLSITAIQLPVSSNLYGRDLDNFPEVVPEVVPEQAPPTNTRPESLFSDYSGSGSSKLIPSTPSRKPHTWQFLFKAKRGPSSIPVFSFFSSGERLLLWNERGFGFYDLHDANAIRFRRIGSYNARMAAGGKNICAIIRKIGTDYALLAFQGSCGDPMFQRQIEGPPFAMAVSRNDHYIALKFSSYVQIFDVASKEFFRHELPHKNGRSGLSNNLIAFSNDSTSFIASTRYEPEKVITYWNGCRKTSEGNTVESSAPFGLVGDDGLSSLVYSSSSSHWAFLATFTEKGFPVLLKLSDSKPVAQQLRDNNQQIGSKIHRATLCAAGTNLVIINQRNDIYWVLDASTPDQGARYVANIKRTGSVKREVELGMPNSDEVHVFWIDRGQGKLVTVGKLGGKSKPVGLDVDMSQLIP